MRTLLLALAACLALVASAQNVIYRSYAEYAANGGEQVEGPMDAVPRMGRFVLTYMKAGSGQSIACRKIWGFRYRNILFRIEQEDHLPVRLMSKGAVFYWENGFAHLRMLRDSTESSAINYGAASYLSYEIEGDIVPASFKDDDTRSPSGEFRSDHPLYSDLVRCIGAGADMDQVRQCVVEYNVSVEEGRAPEP